MSFVALATTIGGAATSLLVGTGLGTAAGTAAGAAGAGLLGAGATGALASGIGAVGAGALGGAGLGALTSAVTGGDIGKGALYGALGGGVSGGLSSAIGSLGSGAATAGTSGVSATTPAGGVVNSAGAVAPPPVTPPVAPAPTVPTPAVPPPANMSPALLPPQSGLPPELSSLAPKPTFGSSPLPPTPTPGVDSATLANARAADYLSKVAPTAQTPTAQVAVPPPSPYANTLFEQYGVPIIGLGAMAGNYLGSDTQPTQAGPPPGSGDNFLSYYKFNPRRYRPSQPFYIKPANYAAGGIASLNPNPDMMASGPARVDFMGADAYPTSQQKLNFYSTPSQMPTSAQQAVASYEPATNPLTGVPMANFARGGISDLGGYSDGGRMTEGPGDGMSDSIPASIAGKRPARLAQGEFVVPADVVSHLGNGSTDAGAKQLYSMMDRVRKARTGRKAQGKQIKADKMMPA